MTEQPQIAAIYSGMNVFQRLHKVMETVDYIQREQKAGMRYKIVSHDKVTAKVRPELVKWGIVYFPLPFAIEQNGNRSQVAMSVRFQSIDDAADHFDVGTAGYGIDDQDKGPGKAISYCVKYALLKALGLESGDDPDEDQHTDHVPAGLLDITRNIGLAASAEDLDACDRDIRALYKKGGVTKAQATATLGEIKAKAVAIGIVAA